MVFINLYEIEKRNILQLLQGVVMRLRRRDDGDDVTNVQYKSNRNGHYESPLISNRFK
jgi:hypothetical protein